MPVGLDTPSCVEQRMIQSLCISDTLPFKSLLALMRLGLQECSIVRNIGDESMNL